MPQPLCGHRAIESVRAQELAIIEHHHALITRQHIKTQPAPFHHNPGTVGVCSRINYRLLRLSCWPAMPRRIRAVPYTRIPTQWRPNAMGIVLIRHPQLMHLLPPRPRAANVIGQPRHISNPIGHNRIRRHLHRQRKQRSPRQTLHQPRTKILPMRIRRIRHMQQHLLRTGTPSQHAQRGVRDVITKTPHTRRGRPTPRLQRIQTPRNLQRRLRKRLSPPLRNHHPRSHDVAVVDAAGITNGVPVSGSSIIRQSKPKARPNICSVYTSRGVPWPITSPALITIT